MPVPKIEEPPRSQASTRRSRPSPRECAGDERRGGDDVDARLEDADQLVDVEPHRVVDDAVGLQREQRVDVVRRRDPDRLDAAELADVVPDLVRRPGVATDQLEVGLATIASTDSCRRCPSSTARPGNERCCALVSTGRATEGSRALVNSTARKNQRGLAGALLSAAVDPRQVHDIAGGSDGPARRSAWWPSPATFRRGTMSTSPIVHAGLIGGTAAHHVAHDDSRLFLC